MVDNKGCKTICDEVCEACKIILSFKNIHRNRKFVSKQKLDANRKKELEEKLNCNNKDFNKYETPKKKVNTKKKKQR
jgi:hypothetical protein